MGNFYSNTPNPQKRSNTGYYPRSNSPNTDYKAADFVPFYPIPQATADLLNTSPKANFSLCSPRLVQWIQSGETIKKPESDKKKEITGTIELLCDAANSKMPQAADILKRYHKRQNAYIEFLKKRGMQTLTLYARLTAPFITGLGSGHPTETGMILDRNTGLPYLPASSIKGVLRLAYAITIANGRSEVPDSELLSYFGSTDTNHAIRGQIVFLDAYPYTEPSLKTNIMNPHFGKYYSSVTQPHSTHQEQAAQSKNGQKNILPLETESPVPLQFLTVEEGVVFVFRAYFLPLQKKIKKENNSISDYSAKDVVISGTTESAECIYNDFSAKDSEALHKAFSTAFTVTGFGGKTAIGYGRFTEITEEEAEKVANGTSTTDTHIAQSEGTLTVAPELHKHYTVRLAEKKLKANGKITWKVAFIDFENYSGSITNSVDVQNGIIDSLVTVEVLAETTGGSFNCKYLGAIHE